MSDTAADANTNSSFLFVARRLPLFLCVAFFVAVWAVHDIAVVKAHLIAGSRPALEKKIALVSAVEDHSAFIWAYFITLSLVLIFILQRNYPWWSAWSTGFVLLLPWFLYFYVCIYLANQSVPLFR